MLFALALFAAPVPQTADADAQKPVLDIDACVDVERPVVENLVELELRGGRRPDAETSILVAVRCLDAGQEIRVEPWASLGRDAIRAIELRAVNDPAAREARSRELALAIAELIRRLEITHPLPSPPPSPPAALATSSPAPVDVPQRQWQLGLLASFDTFTGGQTMAGGDLFFAVRIGRWLLGEIRVGGRLVDGESWTAARLTGRAGSAAVAIGPIVESKWRTVVFVPLLRAQGYAIDYRAESSGEDTARTARLAALTIAAEPRIFVALSRALALTAGAGVGFPIHGIVVRTQGAKAESLTGISISASLGATVTF